MFSDERSRSPMYIDNVNDNPTLSINTDSDPSEQMFDCEDESPSPFSPALLFSGVVLLPVGRSFDLSTFDRYYIRFLLELREGHLLPQNVVQSITTYLCSLLEIVCKLTGTRSSSLCSCQLSPVISVNDLDDVMSHVTKLMLTVASNEYQFLKGFVKHFGYEPPEEIKMPNGVHSTYIVPIEKSLAQSLNYASVVQALINNFNEETERANRDRDLLYYFRQGQLAKANRSFDANPNTLMLQLYTDGIAVTNPIGPKKDAHKLTCFYFLIDDLQNTSRSQLTSIGLLELSYIGLQLFGCVILYLDQTISFLFVLVCFF